MLSIKCVLLDYNTLFKYIYIPVACIVTTLLCIFIPFGICLILPPTVWGINYSPVLVSGTIFPVTEHKNALIKFVGLCGSSPPVFDGGVEMFPFWWGSETKKAFPQLTVISLGPWHWNTDNIWSQERKNSESCGREKYEKLRLAHLVKMQEVKNENMNKKSVHMSVHTEEQRPLSFV